MKIYCDGACSGNPGIGGWALQVHYDDGIIREFGGREDDVTTNNRMELTAVIKAMEHAHQQFDTVEDLQAARVEIISDSKYVVRGATEWLMLWRKRQFCKINGERISNEDLWRTFSSLSPEAFVFTWIKGHDGTNCQERVDQLACDLSRNKPVQFFYGRPNKQPERHYPIYLVFRPEDNQIQRFKTWNDCQKAVSGVKNIHFKKVSNSFQEEEQLRAWGFKEIS